MTEQTIPYTGSDSPYADMPLSEVIADIRDLFEKASRNIADNAPFKEKFAHMVDVGVYKNRAACAIPVLLDALARHEATNTHPRRWKLVHKRADEIKKGDRIVSTDATFEFDAICDPTDSADVEAIMIAEEVPDAVCIVYAHAGCSREAVVLPSDQIVLIESAAADD
jgi:hypothetical protein